MNRKRRASWGVLLVLAVAMLWSCQQENALEPDVADVEDAVLAGKGPPPGKGPKPQAIESVEGRYDMILWQWSKQTDYGRLYLIYDDEKECSDAYEAHVGTEKWPCERRDRSFTFWAKRYGDEARTVEGEWRLMNTFPGTPKPDRDQGKVTCFTIAGNQAWIGGTWRQAPWDDEVVFRVQDGPDVSSLMCAGLPTGGEIYKHPEHECYGLNDWGWESYCADTPPSMPQKMFTLVKGGIEIKPEGS